MKHELIRGAAQVFAASFDAMQTTIHRNIEPPFIGTCEEPNDPTLCMAGDRVWRTWGARILSLPIRNPIFDASSDYSVHETHLRETYGEAAGVIRTSA